MAPQSSETFGERNTEQRAARTRQTQGTAAVKSTAARGSALQSTSSVRAAPATAPRPGRTHLSGLTEPPCLPPCPGRKRRRRRRRPGARRTTGRLEPGAAPPAAPIATSGSRRPPPLRTITWPRRGCPATWRTHGAAAVGHGGGDEVDAPEAAAGA